MDIDEIRERLKARGMTVRELATLVPMDENKLTKSLGRQRRKLTVQEMDGIRRVLLEPANDGPEEPVRELPVIGLVAAGAWREAIEGRIETMPCPDPRLPTSVFVVQVDGDSMDKVAEDGTNIVVDPKDRDLISKRYYVVRNGHGDTTFKQFFSDPARLEPCSTNPEHKTIYIGSEPFEVIGRALMMARWL